jgi:hypothetical protein
MSCRELCSPSQGTIYKISTVRNVCDYSEWTKRLGSAIAKTWMTAQIWTLFSKLVPVAQALKQSRLITLGG